LRRGTVGVVSTAAAAVSTAVWWSAVRRRSYPPDSSYKYNPIEKHGCNGTKVDCPECEGMEGLSRYDQ
jgi:hypothetical protein